MGSQPSKPIPEPGPIERNGQSIQVDEDLVKLSQQMDDAFKEIIGQLEKLDEKLEKVIQDGEKAKNILEKNKQEQQIQQ